MLSVKDCNARHIESKGEIFTPMFVSRFNRKVKFRAYCSAHTSRPNLISQEEEQLVSQLAERTSQALSNMRLKEKLLLQSIQDPLTGLFNRLHMENTLERELSRAQRQERPLSVVMLDIDYFKQLNDTLGHEAGDVFLQEIGKYLQKHIRTCDAACRYGGDEFTLIFPESSLEDTCKRVDQLRQEIKTMSIRYQGSEIGAMTISLGIASYPTHGKSSRDLLLAADMALYRAKQDGRDCLALPLSV